MSFRKPLVVLLAAGFTTLACATTAMASSTQTYTATGTDTFWTIAQQFHVSVSALEDANPTVKPLDIYAGLDIQVPVQNTNTAAPAIVDNDTIQVNGFDQTYSKEINCVATAYTASVADNPWGAVDYLGNPLKLGTVAVDPSVIPLGSTLYITGYHFNGLPTDGMIFHATDEGGAIKGQRVDLFLPTSQSVASNFGMQNVKVYVLK